MTPEMQVGIQIGLAALGTLLGVVGFVIAFLLRSNFAALRTIWENTMEDHDGRLSGLERTASELRRDFEAWQRHTAETSATSTGTLFRLEEKLGLLHQQNVRAIEGLAVSVNRIEASGIRIETLGIQLADFMDRWRRTNTKEGS